MSKQTSSRKARRDRKPNVPPHTGPVGSDDSLVAASAATSAPVSTSKTSGSRASQPVLANQPVDYRAEYSYVGKDLKQMALVAAAMLVLLVVLSFVIV
jgi:hypothetical protein